MNRNEILIVIQVLCFLGALILTVVLLNYHSRQGTFIEILNSIRMVGAIVTLFFTTYVLQNLKRKE